MASTNGVSANVRVIAGSAVFLAAVTGVGVLIYGRNLLIPIALAVLVTVLLNAMTARLQRLPLGTWRLPRWLCLVLSLALIVALFAFAVEMVAATMQEMVARAPAYQTNVETLIGGLKQRFELTSVPTLSEFLDKINLTGIVRNLLSAISGLAGSAGLIALYVAFLLVEQRNLDAKLVVISEGDTNRLEKMRKLLDQISYRIRTYMFVKTVLAVLNALCAYIVMVAVGLDFAVFWAFLTFVTYYIPTIGSIIAIAFPTLLALVQFETPSEALIILVVSGGLQTIIANVIEPRFMGRSMNLSTFVIIVSLFAWGSVWGIVGMFLCVPLTVIVMIVLAHFPRTWRIAVMLSSDGKVDRPPG